MRGFVWLTSVGVILSGAWMLPAHTSVRAQATGAPSQVVAPPPPAATTQTTQPSTEVTPADARSPRNANYSIDVRLDHQTRTLTGREVITWRNITSRPTSELQFHLYFNAWKNTSSTWMRERLLAGDPASWQSVHPRIGDGPRCPPSAC